MSRRARLATTAVVAVAALLAGGCSGGSHKTDSPDTTSTTSKLAATPTREVTVGPLRTQKGQVGPIAVKIRPTTDGAMRVVVDARDAGATRAQWEAAGWSAVATATLLTGAPLGNREITFTVNGPADGTSSSGLMTVAVIALIRGDQLEPGITMTGTINPDGTIGPVPGIVEKIDNAGAAHKQRALIPVGTRESKGGAGKVVDVVARGRQKGVEVSETPDVYDAYQQFTGRPLPQMPAPGTTRLAAEAYDKLKGRVDAWLEKYDAARDDFETLAPAVQQDLRPFARAARLDDRDAKKLAGVGLQAGALSKAVDAAAVMNAVAQVGQSFPLLVTQGPAPFVARIQANQSVSAQIEGLVDDLKGFAPQTVSDAGALIAAYGYAIDALSSSQFAQSLFRAPAASPEVAVSQAAQGAVYHELAGSLVEAARESLSVGRGLGGAALGRRVDVAREAEFFHRAAAANLRAFRAIVLAPAARAQGVPLETVERSFVAADSEYALARTGDAVLRALPAYFANGPTTDYAQLGGALGLYTRSVDLLARYSSLARVDPATLAVTGIGNDDAFNSAIGLAQSRLASSIGALRAKGVNPVIAAADNEVAGADQNGDAADQFAALSAYWHGYLHSRVLAYLGGFPEPPEPAEAPESPPS